MHLAWPESRIGIFVEAMAEAVRVTALLSLAPISRAAKLRIHHIRDHS